MEAQRRWSQAARGDGRPPSTYQLFNAIVVVRWFSLAVVSVGYVRNLTTRELDYGTFVPALALAILYLAIVTLFTARAYRLRLAGPVLVIADYAVSFVILCLSAGVWTPLFIYVLCSSMMAGLRGRISNGVLGAAALSGLYLIALIVKGVTPASLVASDSVALVFVYNFEIMLFSVVWAYAAGLVVRFNEAVRSAAEARDAMAVTHEHLDRHRQELLAIHAVRDAALNLTDLDEILHGVLEAMREDGFRDPRIVLWDEGVPDVSPADAAVPIAAGDEAVGTLLVECPPEGLPAEKAQLLELFAGQVALAVQHVRLLEQGREYAVAGERNRIAIEIHDAVLQKVYGASLLAESVSDDDFEPSGAAGLARLREEILSSLRDLRVVVLNWDSLGWGLPLLAAADRYLEEFGDIAELRVRLASYGVERESDTAKMKDLLAIMQEALSNAWRHSAAHSVTVALAFEAEDVCLSVRDDGHGFDPAESRDAWVGLKTIHERAARHSGRVFLASAPGEGTQVRVEMPW